MSLTKPPPTLYHSFAGAPASGPSAMETTVRAADNLVRVTSPAAHPVRRPLSPSALLRRLRVVSVLAGMLALLLAGGSVLHSRPVPHSSPVSGAPIALPRGGTLLSSHTGGSGALLLRSAGGHLVSLSMAGKHLLTREGQALSLSSVRPGDTFTMRSATAVLDTSQTRINVQGIVSSSPDPNGTVMTLQLSPTHTLLVDIGSHARINGKVLSATSLMSISDADPVRVAGVLDTALDEITETSTIDVINPSSVGGSALTPGILR